MKKLFSLVIVVILLAGSFWWWQEHEISKSFSGLVKERGEDVLGFQSEDPVNPNSTTSVEELIGMYQSWRGGDGVSWSHSPSFLEEDIVAIDERTMAIGGHGDGLLSWVNTPIGQALLFQVLVDSPVADESLFPRGAAWKTVDAVLLSEMDEKSYFAFFCGDRYKPVLPDYPQEYPEVLADLGSTTTVRVAIAEKTEEPVSKTIKYAWKADLNTGKLEEISTQGIICHNQLLFQYWP